MDNLEISDMTISDFEIILPVLSSDFDNFWSAEVLKSELHNKSSRYIVAKLDRKDCWICWNLDFC